MNNRILRLKKIIAEKGLDATLVSSVPNITYLTCYSGFSKEEREVLLLITANEQYVLTDKRYVEEINNYIKDFKMEEVSSSTPFRAALERLIKKHKIKKLGIEEDNLTITEYKSLKRCSIGLNHWSMASLRTVKENDEIKVIEKACKLTDKTFEYILTKIKSGITERELAFEIEFFIKKNGGDLAFDPIVAFGKNSAVPHHKVTSEILKPPKGISTTRVLPSSKGRHFMAAQVQDDNENIILLDFGAKVDNYCSDMTRVVSIGKATDEQKKVYETGLTAQQKAIELLNRDHPCSGMIPAKNVDKAAHDYIRSKGFGENIFHSLGHGVGLEIHESPRLSSKSKETLESGMVFTIEPGIYLPEKFGVRIEDTVVLEKNGLRLLTHSPKTLIEL